MTNHQSPIVSICCLSYNHAPFIRKALDGFLMQEPPSCMPKDAKLSDWCEILIHDDCSTDGTDAIIREYAAKYPDVIFPLYEEINQYTHGGKGRMDFFNYNRARGKYIAVCEADDYWTDPHKLQKQVDFMEANPDYSVCFHGCIINNIRLNRQYVSPEFRAYELSTNSNKSEQGVDVTAADFFKENCGQPLTMLFRLSMFNFDWHNRYKYYRDTHEIYHLLNAGKGYWMNFNGGVYNVHDGGVAGGLTRLGFCNVSLPIDREFYWKTLDPLAKKQYINTLDACVAAYRENNKGKAIWCAIVRFFVSRHPKSLMRNLKIIFSK